MQEDQSGLDISAKHDFNRSFPSGGMGNTAVVQQKFAEGFIYVVLPWLSVSLF